jgi:hypothetical protein
MTLLPEVEQALLDAIRRSNDRSAVRRRLGRLRDAAFAPFCGEVVSGLATRYYAWRLRSAVVDGQMAYDARAVRIRPRFALGALAGLAAIAGALVAIVGLGTGAQEAFAGWSPTPTHASDAQIGQAEKNCDAQLATNATPAPFSTATVSGWQLALADTRGPFTYVVLTSGGDTATCFRAPSFTRLAGYTQTADSGLPADSAQIQTSGVELLGTDGEPYSGTGQIGASYRLVEGRTGAAVTGVTLVLDDTTRVTATVGGGAFAAWWPGTQNATSIIAATGTGATTTQQLAPQPGSGDTPSGGTGHTGPTATTGATSATGRP